MKKQNALSHILISLMCLSLLGLASVSNTQASSFTAENAWISDDSSLTGRAGNGQIRASAVNNLGARAFGGFWSHDTGTVQITLDTYLGNDYFYAKKNAEYTVSFTWKFNGYHQDRGSASVFTIGYAIEKTNVALDTISSHWTWEAPDGEDTTWSNQIVTHSYTFTPTSSGNYRFAIALVVHQSSGTWDVHTTDFHNGDREIELQSISYGENLLTFNGDYYLWGSTAESGGDWTHRYGMIEDQDEHSCTSWREGDTVTTVMRNYGGIKIMQDGTEACNHGHLIFYSKPFRASYPAHYDITYRTSYKGEVIGSPQSSSISMIACLQYSYNYGAWESAGPGFEGSCWEPDKTKRKHDIVNDDTGIVQDTVDLKTSRTYLRSSSLYRYRVLWFIDVYLTGNSQGQTEVLNFHQGSSRYINFEYVFFDKYVPPPTNPPPCSFGPSGLGLNRISPC